ncbi:MAG: hypothetical protein LBR10_14025 [Prevotellaceae bacterium]|jgi:hypothetical protein|nr:hypothetical protein [Prevotellaceae bacterium]
MDNNTITSLLKHLIMEYDRVSLPCLGSFLSEYAPAFISEGVIYPPSKSIVFHQNEIWNDEKLENSFARINNVSIGVAKEELAFWIDDICVLLATSEKVMLPGLGRLYVSGQEKLIFEQDYENLLPESFGLEPTNIPSREGMEQSLYLKKEKQENKYNENSNKGLGIAAVIIVVFAAIAGIAIARHILDGNQSANKVIATEAPKEDNTVKLNFSEYVISRYGICLSSFENYRDAKKFSENIEPATEIYCTNTATPYSVILSGYPSLESAKLALDSLKTNVKYSKATILKIENPKLLIR